MIPYGGYFLLLVSSINGFPNKPTSEIQTETVSSTIIDKSLQKPKLVIKGAKQEGAVEGILEGLVDLAFPPNVDFIPDLGEGASRLYTGLQPLGSVLQQPLQQFGQYILGSRSSPPPLVQRTTPAPPHPDDTFQVFVINEDKKPNSNSISGSGTVGGSSNIPAAQNSQGISNNNGNTQGNVGSTNPQRFTNSGASGTTNGQRVANSGTISGTNPQRVGNSGTSSTSNSERGELNNKFGAINSDISGGYKPQVVTNSGTNPAGYYPQVSPSGSSGIPNSQRVTNFENGYQGFSNAASYGILNSKLSGTNANNGGSNPQTVSNSGSSSSLNPQRIPNFGTPGHSINSGIKTQYGQSNSQNFVNSGTSGQYGQSNSQNSINSETSGQYGQSNSQNSLNSGAHGQYGQSNSQNSLNSGAHGQYGQSNPQNSLNSGAHGQYSQSNLQNSGAHGQYSQSNPQNFVNSGTSQLSGLNHQRLPNSGITGASNPNRDVILGSNSQGGAYRQGNPKDTNVQNEDYDTAPEVTPKSGVYYLQVPQPPPFVVNTDINPERFQSNSEDDEADSNKLVGVHRPKPSAVSNYKIYPNKFGSSSSAHVIEVQENQNQNGNQQPNSNQPVNSHQFSNQQTASNNQGLIIPPNAQVQTVITNGLPGAIGAQGNVQIYVDQSGNEPFYISTSNPVTSSVISTTEDDDDSDDAEEEAENVVAKSLRDNNLLNK